MRSLRIASVFALAVLLLITALPAGAYVIILYGGTRIEAREKPVLQGRNWVFVDKLGTRKMIPKDELDEKKTKEVNESGVGDSYLLPDVPQNKPDPASEPRKDSLSSFIRSNKKSIQAPTPAPGGSEVGSALRPPAGGAPAAPAGAGASSTGTSLDVAILEAFTRAFEMNGVRGTKLTQAGPASLRLQAVTDTEQHVFAALTAVARGLKESRAAGKQLEKVDVYLSTAGGENAGRFQMTPDDAEGLLNGTIPPGKYYVTKVIL